MQDIIFKRYFERRIKQRHKPSPLSVKATLLGFFNRPRKSMMVECVDFNRYGMAITSSTELKEGDKIEFEFRGRYIAQPGIKGVVTSVNKTGASYRYGIAFNYCLAAKDYSRTVDNALSRIEGLFHQATPLYRKQAS